MAGPQCTSCFPFPFLTDCGNGKHGKHPPFAPSYPILSLKLLDQRPIDQPDHSERRKIKLLSGAEHTVRAWQSELARTWASAHDADWATLAVDGHVKVYTGRNGRLPKHFVARQSKHSVHRYPER